MVAASLSGIFVMFILVQAGNSSANHHYSGEDLHTVKEIVIRPARSSPTKLEELETTRTGGQKMLSKTVFGKTHEERKNRLNVEDSEISGNDIHASIKQSGKSQFLTQQNEWNKAASATADLMAGTHQDSFQHSSPASITCRKGTTSNPETPLPCQSNDSNQYLQSQKLTDAGDEILNLVNSDYPRPRKPRGTPPINNYEPFSKEITKP